MIPASGPVPPGYHGVNTGTASLNHYHAKDGGQLLGGEGGKIDITTVVTVFIIVHLHGGI